MYKYCRHNNILLMSISCVVRSFVEATRYLLTLPGVTGQYLLSERFSQDPLENYFSRQRASGGRCDNPTASNTLNSARVFRCRGCLPFSRSEATAAIKEGSLLTSSLLLMIHHCQKGQGRSNCAPFICYVILTLKCFNFICMKQIWSLIIIVQQSQ